MISIHDLKLTIIDSSLQFKLQLLADLGVDNTIKDWYDIVVTEVKLS